MSFRELIPSEVVRRRPPLNLALGDEHLFAYELEKEIPSTVLSRLTKATVLPNGYIVRGLGLRPLPETFTGSVRSPSQAVRRAAQRIAAAPLQAAPMRVERGVLVTDEFSNGYFHWLADCLPRLAVLSDGGFLEGRTLIVPDYAGRFNYVRPTLAAFDLTATVFPGPRRSVLCDDLMVLSPVAPTGNYRPDVMNGLRDRFRGHFGSSGQGGRIYVSRALAGLRRIENESDVQAVFERRGFERIFLEKLSFDEQVKRVGSASILASNHGAGLSNMTWMQAGTVVMELRRSGDAQNNCFFSLASALGIGYRYMTCRPVSERMSAHRGDLHVDVKELDRHLAAIVEASR